LPNDFNEEHQGHVERMTVDQIPHDALGPTSGYMQVSKEWKTTADQYYTIIIDNYKRGLSRTLFICTSTETKEEQWICQMTKDNGVRLLVTIIRNRWWSLAAQFVCWDTINT